MAQASSKEVTRAFYESVSGKDVAASFEKYISTTLVNHAMEGAYTRDTWRDYDVAFFASFEDFSVTVLDQVAEGDKVASRWVFTGRQVTEFAGIQPHGRTGTLSATTIDRVVDERIVEHWIDADYSGFLHQLGN